MSATANPIRDAMGLDEPTTLSDLAFAARESGRETGDFTLLDVIQEQVCPHDAGRIYTWHAGEELCAACCDCGKVLAGGV
jgi:hypothetical protein